MFLAWVNFTAGLIVVLFAGEELAEKRRWLWQPSGYIYAAMVLGGTAVALDSLLRAHHPTEVFFNAVMGMHFARKMWQAHQKRQAAKAEAKVIASQSTLVAKRVKPAKPNRRKRRRG